MLADDAVCRAALGRRQAAVEGGGHSVAGRGVRSARAGVLLPATTPAAFPGEMDHAGRRRVKPPSGRLLRCRYGRAGDTPATGVVLGDYAERKRPALERTRTPTTSSNRSLPKTPTTRPTRTADRGTGSRRGTEDAESSATGRNCGIISRIEESHGTGAAGQDSASKRHATMH